MGGDHGCSVLLEFVCDHLEVWFYPLDLDKLRTRPLPDSCERSTRDPSAMAPDLGLICSGKEQGHSSDFFMVGPGQKEAPHHRGSWGWCALRLCGGCVIFPFADWGVHDPLTALRSLPSQFPFVPGRVYVYSLVCLEDLSICA